MYKVGENPMNTLWRELDWPREKLGNPYDFSRFGDGITRKLLLAALVPKSETGKTRWGHIHVLDVLHHRLYRASKRNNRKDHPAFGEYLYTWDKLVVLAMQAGMPVTSFRNNMNDLVKWGIVYRVQASLSDANSYRLTDPAFKFAQTLQSFALFCEWQCYLGPENTPFTNSQWNVLVEVLDGLPKGKYQSWFTNWMSSPQTYSLIHEWHSTGDGKGQRLCPSQCGIRTSASKNVEDFIESLTS